MRWRTVLILGSACVASAPAGARAGDPPPSTVRLEYSHDERCPDEEEFRDSLGLRVHRELFDPNAAARLVVRLGRRNGLYEGKAELFDPSGVASWSIPLGPIPQDCSAVMDALSISVAIKLRQVGSRPPSSPTAPITPPAPPAPAPQMAMLPPSLPAELKIAPPPRPRPSFYMGLSGGVAFGAVPGVAGTVALDFGVRPPGLPFSFGAQLRMVLPSTIDVPGDQIAIARYTGALVACRHFLRYLAACGLGEAGALLWSAQHSSIPSAFYAALGGRASFEYPVPPLLSVRASVDGLLKITPFDFSRQLLTVQRFDWKAPIPSATLTGSVVFRF